MVHEYADPDDEDGFLEVREMSDEELTEELAFVARLMDAMTDEMRFRWEQYGNGERPQKPNEGEELNFALRFQRVMAKKVPDETS